MDQRKNYKTYGRVDASAFNDRGLWDGDTEVLTPHVITKMVSHDFGPVNVPQAQVLQIIMKLPQLDQAIRDSLQSYSNFELSTESNGYHVCVLSEPHGTYVAGMLLHKINDECEVIMLNVHEHYRRKGLGKAMIQTVAELFQTSNFTGAMIESDDAYYFWQQFDDTLPETRPSEDSEFWMGEHYFNFEMEL